MDGKSIIGRGVTHISYGTGTIVDVDELYIKVQYEKDGKTRKYQFPGIFSKYLTIDDSSLQKELENMIQNLPKDKDMPTVVQTTEKKKETFRKESIEYPNSFATHAETLNICFGLDKGQAVKAYWKLDDGYSVWFPNIAKRYNEKYESTDKYSGWVNIAFDGGKTIIQIDNPEVPSKPPTGEDTNRRLVFAKFDGEERYTFMGVYAPAVRVENGYKFTRIGIKFDTVNKRIIE